MYNKVYNAANWEGAIAEADRLAREAKALAARLRATARGFRKLKESGVPFPGPVTPD